MDDIRDTILDYLRDSGTGQSAAPVDGGANYSDGTDPAEQIPAGTSGVLIQMYHNYKNQGGQMVYPDWFSDGKPRSPEEEGRG